MGKLSLDMSIAQCMIVMADSNPGAAVAIMNIMQQTSAIDPDNALGGIGYVMDLDEMGIYGTDIYVLYSDICNKELPKFLAVLRAKQLGLLDTYVLQRACARQDLMGKTMINVEDLYQKVRERLPAFNNPSVAGSQDVPA